MTSLLKKLQWDGMGPMWLVAAPAELVRLLRDGDVQFTTVPTATSLVLAFAQSKAEVTAHAREICPQWATDKPLWIAYPKQTSKRYRADFNRDTGFDVLGDMGFEGVRQIAIDEDWSALRFRRVEFIASLKRNSARALSAEGKRRTQ
jgi:hypothetical protein